MTMMTFRSNGGKRREVYFLGLLLLVIARISLTNGQQGTWLLIKFLPQTRVSDHDTKIL